MTLSTAMVAALSGLNATTRATDVAASNIANAGVDGFIRRELPVSSFQIDGVGMGVRADAVTLSTAPYLTLDRRLAEADLGYQSAIAGGALQLETAVGGPDDSASLFTYLENFQTSLSFLADDPTSATTKNLVLNDALALADRFNAINDDVIDIRSRADSEIADHVDKINEILPQIAELNKQAERTASHGKPNAEVRAQQQVLVDELTAIIPVEAYEGDNGQITVFMNGYKLVQRTAVTFGFSEANTITSSMDLVGGVPGSLSTLTMDGVDITPSTIANSPVDNGALAGLFHVRDVSTVTFQNQIDALADELIYRFTYAESDIAHTVAEADVDSGQHLVYLGLFTDAGDMPTGQLGSAGRIAVNAAFDTAQGGSLVELHSGLGGLNTLDSGTGVTYSLTNDAGGLFEIDATTGDVSLVTGQSLDFAMATSHTITVQSASGGVNKTQNVTFTVIDSTDTERVVTSSTAVTVSDSIADTDVVYSAATTELDAGDNTNLLKLLGALTTEKNAPADSGLTGAHGVVDLIADFSTLISTSSFSNQQSLTFRVNTFNTMRSAEVQATGVDIDIELATLTNLQNAYAANAQVLTTIDEMFNALLQAV